MISTTRPGKAWLPCAIVLACLCASGSARAASPEEIWRVINGVGRHGDTAVYDPVEDRILIIAGNAHHRMFIDGWQLPLSAAHAWMPLAASGTPPAAGQYHVAVYDAGRHGVLLLGGWPASGDAGSVRELMLADSPAWVDLHPSGTPPDARLHPVAIFDPARDRLILYGGVSPDSGRWLTDTWELTLGSEPAWNRLDPDGATPPPGRGTAIYDPDGDRMVMISTISDALTVWALELSGAPVWTLLSPSGTPPVATSGFRDIRAVHDPALGRILVGPSRALALGDDPAWVPTGAAGTPGPAPAAQTSGGSLTESECLDLASEYSALLAEARRCKLHKREPQCDLKVSDSLICPCGGAFVDPENEQALEDMTAVSEAFEAGACGGQFECGAGLCPSIPSAQCLEDPTLPHPNKGLCFNDWPSWP